MKQSWRVELRAWPDTPREEEFARKQGRTLGPQTVVYPDVYAMTFEEACQIAVEYEISMAYRRHVVVFNSNAILDVSCDCCGG